MLDPMRSFVLATMLAIPPFDDGCLARLEDAEPLDPPRRAAQQLWLRECADCHGLTGAADGQLAGHLVRPPHSFADACHPIADEWIARVILEGGESFGGDPAMREHHQLAETPDVLAALVELVQGFRSGQPCDDKPHAPIVGPDELD